MINDLIIIIGVILLGVILLAFWIWLMEQMGIFEEEKRDMFGRIIHEKDKE